MQKSSETSEDDEVFRGTFEQQCKVGDYLCNGKQYGKAIRSYSAALEKKPLDRECLVRRAKCHLWFGDPDAALRDAEQSLKKDPTFSRGLHVMAEAHYYKGEFEQALMYFHRGYQLTAGQEQFRLGIQKAREAIHNAVGSPRRVKLSREGDMSYFDQLVLKDKGLPRRISCMSDVAARDLPVRVAKNPRGIKKLLGKLYDDRVYLEGLLGEPVLKDGPPEIQNLVVDGLKYINGRTEFWRQQRRITDRPKHDRIWKSKKISWHTIKQELESVESQLVTGNPAEVIQECRKLEAQADKWDLHVPKEKTMGKIYSYMGLAHQELGDNDQAVECFETDLCLGRDHKIVENQFRALLNLGHLYTENENYRDAAAVWCDAIEICTSDVETMWMYHELGHCYQELGAVDDAYMCGEHSLQLARRLADWNWQMNALVLLAKASLQMERKREALRHFNRAIELSSLLKDTQAKQAITKAAHGLQEQIKMEETSSAHSMDAITKRSQLELGIDAKLYAEKLSDRTASEHSAKGKREGSVSREQSSKENKEGDVSFDQSSTGTPEHGMMSTLMPEGKQGNNVTVTSNRSSTGKVEIRNTSEEREEGKADQSTLRGWHSVEHGKLDRKDNQKAQGHEHEKYSQEQKEHSHEQKEHDHKHAHKHSEHRHRPPHGDERKEHHTHHHGHHGHDPKHMHHEHHHASKEPEHEDKAHAHQHKGHNEHHHEHKDHHDHEHKDHHHGHDHVHHHHRHHHNKHDNDGSFPNFPSDMSVGPDGAEPGESPEHVCECQRAPTAEMWSKCISGPRLSYEAPELFVPNSSLVDMLLPKSSLDSIDSSFNMRHSSSSKEYDSTDNLAVP